MPHRVETSVEVNLDPDTLWREIGSFQAIGKWHPMLQTVEGMGEEPGALRTAVGKDGQKQVERLEEANPIRHFYRYAIISTTMPVRDYVARFGISGNASGKSTLFWNSKFEITSSDERKIEDLIRGFLLAGL
jgi:hypothetical protein